MYFKGKREIKAEVKRLTKSNDELSEQINDANGNNADLLDRVAVLDKEVDRIKEAACKIETERNKLKNMVREQTEADLLVNAMKGVGIIKDGPAVNYDVFSEQRRLVELQRQAATMNTTMRQGFGSLGAGLLGVAAI